MDDDIKLTLEEQAEEEILAQDDAVEVIARSANDPFQTHIYRSVESKTLDKKVVTVYQYREESDVDGNPGGRSCQGRTKEIKAYDDEIQITSPVLKGVD